MRSGLGQQAKVLAVVNLGLARAALDVANTMSGGSKTTTGASQLADRAYYRIELAKAEAQLRSARAFFYEATDSVWQSILAGNDVTPDQVSLLRLSATQIAREGADVVNRAYRLGGTVGDLSQPSAATSRARCDGRHATRLPRRRQLRRSRRRVRRRAGDSRLPVSSLQSIEPRNGPMSDNRNLPLRVLFCCGVSQNFFDLPREQIGEVWQAYGKMLNAIEAMENVRVLGVMDDDRLVVGNADSAPWTFYIMADVADFDTAVAVCNLYRTTPVGDYNLWRYGKIEARVGRALTVPPAVANHA
ncbi:hypothetical protein OKW28_001775 [Paraburkholderia sp. 40]